MEDRMMTDRRQVLGGLAALGLAAQARAGSRALKAALLGQQDEVR